MRQHFSLSVRLDTSRTPFHFLIIHFYNVYNEIKRSFHSQYIVAVQSNGRGEKKRKHNNIKKENNNVNKVWCARCALFSFCLHSASLKTQSEKENEERKEKKTDAGRKLLWKYFLICRLGEWDGERANKITL